MPGRDDSHEVSTSRQWSMNVPSVVQDDEPVNSHERGKTPDESSSARGSRVDLVVVAV